MNNRLLRIIQIVIVICCFFNITFAQNMNYGYDNWPGKSGVIKSNIELPTQLISKFNLTLAQGSKETSFFYKISLDENDQIKKGRLQAEIFSSIEEAQSALVEYLDCLTTPYKPPRLTNEGFKIGDIAFGEVNNGILRMAFTRNNVLLVVHAPINKAKEIAQGFDKNIQVAPEWKKDTSKPSFVLTE
jgi:hypothetical protein